MRVYMLFKWLLIATIAGTCAFAPPPAGVHSRVVSGASVVEEGAADPKKPVERVPGLKPGAALAKRRADALRGSEFRNARAERAKTTGLSAATKAKKTRRLAWNDNKGWLARVEADGVGDGWYSAGLRLNYLTRSSASKPPISLSKKAIAQAEEAKRAEAAARDAIRNALEIVQDGKSPLAKSKALKGAVALSKAAQLTESSEPLLANVTRALADATRALAEPASPAPAPVKNTDARKAGGFSLNPFKKNEKAEKPAAGAPAAEITATGEAEATKETAEPPKPTGGVMGDPFIASDFNGFKDGYDFKSGGEKGKGYYKK